MKLTQKTAEEICVYRVLCHPSSTWIQPYLKLPVIQMRQSASVHMNWVSTAYTVTNIPPRSCLAIPSVWPLVAGPCSFSDHRLHPTP